MKKTAKMLINAGLAIVLLVLIYLHIDVNINHYCAQMDADIASEAVLAADIAENGFKVPATWVASTEIRVISSPNLAAFIYPLVGNNMNIAMGIACSILMILLIVVMCIYLKQIGFDHAEIMTALILLLSLSDIATENQSILFLWAGYYVSNFISLFINLIIYNSFLKKNKLQPILVILSLALSVLNGLQGMRGCLYCYIPLLGAEILRYLIFWLRKKDNKMVAILVWSAAATVLNVAVAKLSGPDTLGASRNIRHAGEKFVGKVVPAMNSVINYRLTSIVVMVICLLSVFGCVLGFIHIFSKEDNEDGRVAGTLTPVISFCLCAGLLTFTTVSVAPRYFITELFIVGIGAALFMKYSKSIVKDSIALIVLVIGIIALNYYYQGLIKADNSKGAYEYQIAEWMQQNGYENGYATFDFANSITVFSNNKVKVRAVNSMTEMEGCKWLTDSAWYPPVKANEEATCYVTTDYTEQELLSFIQENNATVLSTNSVGTFRIYVLDHDYTVWERK